MVNQLETIPDIRVTVVRRSDHELLECFETFAEDIRADWFHNMISGFSTDVIVFVTIAGEYPSGLTLLDK